VRFDQRPTSQHRFQCNAITRQHDRNGLPPIERPPQCHHAVTHNVAKLTEHLFVAGTMVPGLASNCSTLELLNVRNADRLSARDALRVNRGDRGRRRALAVDRIYSVDTEE
jgi:hypothetical protein